jgi:hypothetical protein
LEEGAILFVIPDAPPARSGTQGQQAPVLPSPGFRVLANASPGMTKGEQLGLVAAVQVCNWPKSDIGEIRALNLHF